MLEKAEKKRAGLTGMNEEGKQQDADKETRQKTKRGDRRGGMTRDHQAKIDRMLCLGPAHHRLLVATQVSNTNSLLTLNSNALPTESFVTPFADWSGFF